MCHAQRIAFPQAGMARKGSVTYSFVEKLVCPMMLPYTTKNLDQGSYPRVANLQNANREVLTTQRGHIAWINEELINFGLLCCRNPGSFQRRFVGVPLLPTVAKNPLLARRISDCSWFLSRVISIRIVEDT